jgi:beta-galactosidase
MEKLFGCVQDYINLGPDMWHGLTFSAGSGRLPGGVFRQSYIPTGGKKAGHYDDGQCAVVENTYGAGKTRLIGSMAGYGYKRDPKDEYRRYFAGALVFAGVLPVVSTPYNTGLVARIWTVGSDVFLWCINTRPDAQHVLAAPDPERFDFKTVEPLRGGGSVNALGFVEFDLGGRDAGVFRLVK